MATPPSPPILGMYETNGTFPTPGPSAWPSGAGTNLSATYLAWEADWPTYAAPFVAECNSNGLVPFVELEPWNWDQSAILFSAITGGTYDSQLEGYGTAIAATGKPCILTFAHEMNVSGQYPWSQGDTGSGPGGGALTAAEWVAGWKYVHDKVNSTAAGYAIWMWACSAYTGGTTISPAAYWPGFSYVDMVGIDGYPNTQYGDSLGTFTGQIEPTVSIIRGLGWTEPIFISETNLAAMVASGGESITDFVADMYAAGVSGILEFEDASWDLPAMTSAQWTEYNNAIATNYGGGGGGGGGSVSYTQTLIDGFSGSTLNTTSIWRVPVGGDGISVSGGKLIIEAISGDEQVVSQQTANTNLADGIFALQLSQSGTTASGTMFWFGITDGAGTLGNYYEFQCFPIRGQWYSYAGTGAATSGDTGNQDILSLSVWNNGDWLGMGNYNLLGSNDVHVYKSSDGVTWTEIASFEVTGAIDESAVSWYFGTNYDPGTGSENYVATIDNASWFTRGASASSGTGAGGLVQWASNETTGTSLTLTLASAITPGNTVGLALSGYVLGVITGVTIGGTPVTFTKDATSGGYNAELWVAEDVTEASAVIVVTASTPGIIGYAYELTGNRTVSVSAGTHNTSGTSAASGSTAESPSSAQVVIGLAMCIADPGSVTGPASGWTNLPSYSDLESGSGTQYAVGAVSSYQNSSGSAEYDYTGTLGTSGAWGAVTAAFQVPAAPPPPARLLMAGIT